MQVDGRDLVLATYHNIGMMHWATLFWGWLQASGVARLLLLDLDGLTCGASKALLGYHASRLQIECATAADLTLGKQYILGKTASGLQDWGAGKAAPLSQAHVRDSCARACCSGVVSTRNARVQALGRIRATSSS